MKICYELWNIHGFLFSLIPPVRISIGIQPGKLTKQDSIYILAKFPEWTLGIYATLL